MATIPTTAAANTDADALDRAARRLQAWASRHPDAAALAALASLAVRIDSALLRRLRLQLLPRTEPGTEADVWFSGLHESRGRDGVVLDAGVQRLLRAQLTQQPAGDGGERPLEAVWRITAALHADAPEAIRTEEALTWEALRGGDDLRGRVDTLLAPALAAMAGGGEARALEVARWAQRAVPRLPDAARQHPSALALWLAALMRLGLPASRLPDTGEAGLPPALQWLLPAGQVQSLQRVALTPFDDALVLRPLADEVPVEANEISLPRTKPLLLAVRVDGDDATGVPLLQRTVALEATASATRLPLPDGWRALEVSSLMGERWRLARVAIAPTANNSTLLRQRMSVLVLGASGPAGMGTFVSAIEVITVVDVLDSRVLDDARAGGTKAASLPVLLEARDAEGTLHTLRAHVSAVDLRSPLVLLKLQQPFAGAVIASRMADWPESGSQAWTVLADGNRIDGIVGNMPPLRNLPTDRAPIDDQTLQFGVAMKYETSAVPCINGAVVFIGNFLAGVLNLGSARGSGDIVSALPASAVDKFLGWARQSLVDWPTVLLQYKVYDPYDAVRKLELAAHRAKVKLRQHVALTEARTVNLHEDEPVFDPDIKGTIRLVMPSSREDESRLLRPFKLALAARLWAQPGFSLLTIGLGSSPPDSSENQSRGYKTGEPSEYLSDISSETLARRILDLSHSTRTSFISSHSNWHILKHRLEDISLHNIPWPDAVDHVWELIEKGKNREAADSIANLWEASPTENIPSIVDSVLQGMLATWNPMAMRALSGKPHGEYRLIDLPRDAVRHLIHLSNGCSHSPPVLELVTEDPLESVVFQTLKIGLAEAVECSLVEAAQLVEPLNLSVWFVVTSNLRLTEVRHEIMNRFPNCGLLFTERLAESSKQSMARITETFGPTKVFDTEAWLTAKVRLEEWRRVHTPSVRVG